MKSVIFVIAIIGCAVATPPVVTTLVTGFDQNSLHIGAPFGGSISAVLPSVRGLEPIISELAPLALGSLGNLGSLANLGSLGDLGSLGNLASLGNLVSLGARFLPPLPSVQLGAVPFSIPIPYPSFTPATYSARSAIPYPYSIYAGARF